METITRYIATILVGDKYHKEGEEHVISEWNLDKTKSYGLRLEVEERKGIDECTIYHLYPCSLRKVVYELNPIEETPIEGGDRDHFEKTGCGKIGFDIWEPQKDWTERWP